MIYLITDGENFKIGKSKHPAKRLKQLQTGHPSTLKLLAEYDLPDWTERRFHYLLKRLSTRGKGEWFAAPSALLLETLDEIASKLKSEIT